MKAVGLSVIAVLGLACGDNNSKPDAPVFEPHDAPVDTMAMIDAPLPPPTLTTFVIDLIKNHTSSTELPRDYTTFSTLMDPDQTSNNLTAYATLFP